MMRGNSFAQQQVFGMSSHAMTGGSLFAQQQVQWAPYSWLVMSSMVGPGWKWCADLVHKG